MAQAAVVAPLRSPFEAAAQTPDAEQAVLPNSRLKGCFNWLAKTALTRPDSSSSPTAGDQQPCWQSLPDHLLQDIFDLLVDGAKIDHDAARKVSKS